MSECSATCGSGTVRSSRQYIPGPDEPPREKPYMAYRTYTCTNPALQQCPSTLSPEERVDTLILYPFFKVTSILALYKAKKRGIFNIFTEDRLYALYYTKTLKIKMKSKYCILNYLAKAVILKINFQSVFLFFFSPLDIDFMIFLHRENFLR